MLEWLTSTTLETSFLVALVLLSRPVVRRVFGANVAYTLWLIPALAVVLPARPPRPATPLDVIPLPGADISRELAAAAQTWTAPTAFPWEWLWLAGVAAVLVVQLVRVARFRRLARATAEPFAVPAHLSLLLQSYKVSPARVFTTTVPGAPFVTGLVNASVFFPVDFTQRFSVQAQVWVATHELMHIKRGDLWLRLAAELLRAVFWFNPLAHIAMHALRQDQEYACDHAVVSRCTRQERYEYGKALLLGATLERQPSFLGFFGSHKERYIMLGKHRKSALNTLVGTALCALIGVYSLTSSPVSIAQTAINSEFDLSSFTQLNAEVWQARLEPGDAKLLVRAADETGATKEWTVVLPPPSELRESGLKFTFFAPGQGYTITGHRASDPQSYRLLATTITRPDGAIWAR